MRTSHIRVGIGCTQALGGTFEPSDPNGVSVPDSLLADTDLLASHRSPPRPSPGSLHYSDEDVSTKYNDLIPAESSSLTEKPSEISDSQVLAEPPPLWEAASHAVSGFCRGGSAVEMQSP